MRKFLAILLCKLARLIGSRLGRGSSLPGEIALKVDPNILSKVQLPPTVIAVTGSNGKTSTVELIAHIFQSAGKRVAYNKEGSNQIEGVTTLVLANSTLGGKCKPDVLVIESDERFARHTFKHFTPNYYCITNLLRDQLTRNGHPQWLYDIIRDSISEHTQLILNADDPLVACFAQGHNNAVFFGADRLPTASETSDSVYNDGAYCPLCNAPMDYAFFHFNHIGSYRCTACAFARSNAAYSLTNLDFAAKQMTLLANGQAHRLALPYPSLFAAYNTLAAFAVASEAGVAAADIVRALQSFRSQSGRIVTFHIENKPGTLLTSKHENSVSYGQSLRVAAGSEIPCTVLILVDAISRKYYTSETSWLWDIDFHLLANEAVQQVILTGRYCHDLAIRFLDTPIDPARIRVIADIPQAVAQCKAAPGEQVFAVTCFSDKDKLLANVTLDE